MTVGTHNEIYFPETTKDFHHGEYIEANEGAMTPFSAASKVVSNQPGHSVLRTLESLTMKACKMDDCELALGTLYNIARTST